MNPTEWITGDRAQFHCAKQVVDDELVITTIIAPRHKLHIARPVIIPKWNESQKDHCSFCLMEVIKICFN
jgi:hypothetical protein